MFNIRGLQVVVLEKTATRTLRVLAKVQPSFRTNYDYTPGEWYTPSYNVDTKTWTYLTYTPYIEGADQANTTFRITKQSNDPVGPRQNVTDGYISEYYTYPVDDGDKEHRLYRRTNIFETVVQGHYREDYSYTAEGSMVTRDLVLVVRRHGQLIVSILFPILIHLLVL